MNNTQIEQANAGIATEEMKTVAIQEGIPINKLIRNIKAGHTVILKSKQHKCRPIGIGKDLRIKVNANIGTSPINSNIETELEKLKASIRYGADTVMDLSTGGDIRKIRKTIISDSEIPIGTVPVYQVFSDMRNIEEIEEKDFLRSIRSHIDDGVDFLTLHCGVTNECIPLLKKRVTGIVSRGGSLVLKWMLFHNEENPLYTNFDKIIAMVKKYDVVLSLGDGLRPGCLADSTDAAQIEELKILGSLSQKALDRGVQVIIEGPGHVPFNQIKKNVELEKKYCNGAPFYLLGPLVTDISPGYDHIAGAIGSALAAYHGADYLCSVTPMEHLGLPNVQDIIDGIIASKIAAHAIDIAHGLAHAERIDYEMSKARSNLDWNKMYSYSMNPEKAKKLRGNLKDDYCSMCGKFCSIKINKECREKI